MWSRSAAMWAFAATIFVSAYLLFQVQPLIARAILPWFGGSPAVWTTCMLFFQLLLLAGYAFADWSNRRLAVSRQVGLQVAALVAAIVVLPILPDPSWRPEPGADPTWRILLLLTAVVGLPYFVLATSAPLIQAWFGRRFAGASPYRLYALSNSGSLLGLLSYPFVVEPALALESQATLWSGVFWVYALGFAGCGVLLVRGSPAQAVAEASLADAPAAPDPHAHPAAPVTPGNVVLWVLLSACASVMLLATTNQLCQDVAVVPLLWVLPLACYLLSFVVCFASDRAYDRAAFVPATGLCLAALASLIALDELIDFRVQIAVYCLVLFGCCMLCHGEMVRLRPAPAHLTRFYLAMSCGGALGGLLVAVVAPLVFDVFHELPLALVGTLVLWLVAVWRDPRSVLHRGRPRAAWAALVSLTLVYAALNAQQMWEATDGYETVDRNFYGVLRTYTEFDEEFGDDQRVLLHGAIDHGFQYQSPENRLRPVAYYAAESGVGVAASQLVREGGRRIGVVGLGAGALVAHARPGDWIRFYEINPLIVKLARERFSYLADCPGECEVVLGDARLALERELAESDGAGLAYDLLVLDAFSGDAPPAHLLTREAIALYLRHLSPEGVLAVNVSNSYVNLTPIVWLLAEEQGIEPLFFSVEEDLPRGVYAADWVLLTRATAWAEQPAVWNASVDIDPEELAGYAEIRVWTDDYSNLLQLLLH